MPVGKMIGVYIQLRSFIRSGKLLHREDFQKIRFFFFHPEENLHQLLNIFTSRFI